jgi:hypothetical protein
LVFGDLGGHAGGDLDGPGGEWGVGASLFPEQEDLAWRQRWLDMVDGERLVGVGVVAEDCEPWQQRGPMPARTMDSTASFPTVRNTM